MEQNYQVILIDNDLLIRKSWELQAKKENVNLTTFSSIQDFLDNSDKFSHSVTIYIDSDLDDGILGEIEAEKIFNLGFKKLYLASGKSFTTKELPHYILSAESKRPPY